MKHPHIEINPAIMVGKPVIRGTRIPVELVLRKSPPKFPWRRFYAITRD
jgi:uncharacterized protein (DUF433 family)